MQVTRVSCQGRVDVGVGVDLSVSLSLIVFLTQITAASGYWLLVPATVPIAWSQLGPRPFRLTRE